VRWLLSRATQETRAWPANLWNHKRKTALTTNGQRRSDARGGKFEERIKLSWKQKSCKGRTGGTLKRVRKNGSERNDVLLQRSLQFQSKKGREGNNWGKGGGEARRPDRKKEKKTDEELPTNVKKSKLRRE